MTGGMAIPFLQIHDVHQIDHMNCEFFPVVEEKELIDWASGKCL